MRMRDFCVVQEGTAFVVERSYRRGNLFGFTAVQGFPTREAAYHWISTQNVVRDMQSETTINAENMRDKCW